MSKICRALSSASGCFIKFVIAILILLIVIAIAVRIISKNNINKVPLYSNEEISHSYVAGDTYKNASEIALIKINGVILNSQDWEVANANGIRDEIYAAQNNPRVKAILLYINSPGGEITAVDKIYNQVKEAEKQGKTVVAFIDGIGASGGYYIACGANYIVASRLSIVGSIGVIIDSFKVYNLLSKIGIQSDVYKSGDMKDLLNPTRPTTIAEQNLIQNMITESYNVFLSVVSNGRLNKDKKLTVDYLKSSKIADGRIFSGEEALKLGLVDQVGYYKSAVDATIKLAKMNKNNTAIISYDRKEGLDVMLRRLMLNKFSLNVALPGMDMNYKITPGNLYYISSVGLQ